MTESNIRVLALSGSLRRASYNTAALVAVASREVVYELVT